MAWAGRRVNVPECRWTDPQAEAHLFVWLTGIPIKADNVHALAQQGGGKRWKMENEGFRTQKRGGLEMEYAYAKGPTSAKSFYLLLQVAHILSRTLEVYLQGKAAVKRAFGSLGNLGLVLLEALRRGAIPPEGALEAFLAQPIQIRFRPPRASPACDSS